MIQTRFILGPAAAALALLCPLRPSLAQKPAAPTDDDKKVLNDVKVPDGFEAVVFAAPPQVNYPVYVAAATDGTLYVSSDKNGSLGREPNRGSILRVRDTDGDGRADEVKKFVPNVDSPRGLVWDHDRLYLMHPPHLSVYIDKDGDGVSDEEKVLVKNMAFTFKDRPADHTTNGVTLGIDGWLYVACGDFGFMEAEGTDGTKLQLRGGGVVRVRPDGTGLEQYSYGTRNILEVGIDPQMNMFTRDNTNDGGGWDIRLHHFTGLENHGYPRLYMNFGEEIIQPLADYGGGSGCGGLYLSEPGFPEGWGEAMYTADWGTSWVYRHHLTPKGATYTADQKQAFGLTRVTDLDVDGSSQLYVASWRGSTFNYTDENVGYVIRARAKEYKTEALPDFAKLDEAGLRGMLESPSHRRRLEAQREMLRRGLKDAVAVLALASDKTKPLNARVAAIFLLKQALGAKASEKLGQLAVADETVREFAIRALGDRKDQGEGLPEAVLVTALKDAKPRVRLAAVIALGRMERTGAAGAVAAVLGDGDPIISHTAVNVVARLKGSEAAFAVLDSSAATPAQRTGALRALQMLHELPVVDGLISRLAKAASDEEKKGLLGALCRLHFHEGVWKGDSWGTRPDTRGPYYQPEPWEGTGKVVAALKAELAKGGASAGFLVEQMTKHRIDMGEALGTIIEMAKKDPSLLASAVGQIARASNVPADGIALLVKAAAQESLPNEVQSQAVVALAKTDSTEGCKASLVALDQLGEGKKKGGKYMDLAREAFLNNPKLENHHQMLEDLAAKGDVWADAALLALAARKTGSPEAKELSAKALEFGWADPARQVRILKAIALSQHRPWADRVEQAMDDANPEVAKAAKEAAKVLKIVKKPKEAAPQGPMIATLKTDDVIAEVMKTKGDVATGEMLFTRQGCVGCHTVSADQPLRGPFLGNIATLYRRKELAEAVLIPNKSIAQGFASSQFDMKDGSVQIGFVTQEAADQVTLRNVAAQEVVIKTEDIKGRSKMEKSLMPDGLAAGMTVKEFAGLLDYLEALAKKK